METGKMIVMSGVTVSNQFLASARKNVTMILRAKDTQNSEMVKTDVTMQQLLSVINLVQSKMKEKAVI